MSKQDVNLDVEPPKVKARFVEQYELKGLKAEFSIPDFQRKISSPHIRRIVDAILENRFFDIVIKYYVDERGRKQVLDGQQRIEALYAAYEIHGLKHYSLMFLIYDAKFARTAFRRLNMGKPLQTRDHSRALDDGKSEFFNELTAWLTHDRTTSKPTFVGILNALNYAKTRHPISISASSLDPVVEAITKKDIEFMKMFSEACRRTEPQVAHGLIYKYDIYKNVFRVGFEKKLDTDQLIDLLKECMKSKYFKTISTHNMEAVVKGYKVVLEDLLPKIPKARGK